jgi:hypothetical protein
MNSTDLKGITNDELVERFAALASAQDDALLENDLPKVNRLFWQLAAIEDELKARPGDQRGALLRLYDHPLAQVRLKAVKATLAVAPELARRMLQTIADSKEYPAAGEAGMSIDNLHRGIYKPI